MVGLTLSCQPPCAGQLGSSHFCKLRSPNRTRTREEVGTIESWSFYSFREVINCSLEHLSFITALPLETPLHGVTNRQLSAREGSASSELPTARSAPY